MSERLSPIDPANRDTDPRAPAFRIVLFAAFLISGAAYFAWRLTVFNPAAPVVSTIFFVVEILGFLSGTLLFFISQRRKVRSPVAPQPRLSVDVFITTYNEPIDIVRRTVCAAARIRYPHETWLLDDGNRPGFRELAEEFGCRYLARAENTHAKAGNLNNALQHARGDFILLLDADHCAEPDFLTRILGYFRDPTIGFVQTPQEFFNLDSFQHGRDKNERLTWHEQSRFNHVEQSGRDHHGATLMCGCSCVIRRAALDSIGGFATGTVTEDMHTAVRLMKQGWKPAYHDEPLAFGIAPPDFVAFTRQRLRWAEGNLQVCRIERLPFARGIGWRVNLSYALLTLYYVDSWRRLALLLAPPLSLLTDIPPVYGEPMDFWLFFLPFAACGVLCYKEFSGGLGRAWRAETDAMARMTAGLPSISGLFRTRIRFRVTPKTADGRLPPWLLMPQFLVIGLSTGAIGYFAVRHAGIQLGLVADDGIPTGIASILAMLTAWNCVVAGTVMRNVYRAARPAEVNHSHPVRLPIRLRGSAGTLAAVSESISVDAIAVAAGAFGIHEAQGNFDVDIFLPSGCVRARASTDRTAPGELRLKLHWPDLAARDALDQALHAGRWHRVVNGNYETVRTPLEWLGLLTPPPGRLAAGHPVWRPVLVRPHAADGCSPQLGYMLTAAGADRPHGDAEIILFSNLHGPFQIEAGGKLLPGHYEAAGAPRRPQLDENALRCVSGHRHALGRAHERLVRKSPHRGRVSAGAD